MKFSAAAVAVLATAVAASPLVQRDDIVMIFEGTIEEGTIETRQAAAHHSISSWPQIQV